MNEIPFVATMFRTFDDEFCSVRLDEFVSRQQNVESESMNAWGIRQRRYQQTPVSAESAAAGRWGVARACV